METSEFSYHFCKEQSEHGLYGTSDTTENEIQIRAQPVDNFGEKASIDWLTALLQVFSLLKCTGNVKISMKLLSEIPMSSRLSQPT